MIKSYILKNILLVYLEYKINPNNTIFYSIHYKKTFHKRKIKPYFTLKNTLNLFYLHLIGFFLCVMLKFNLHLNIKNAAYKYSFFYLKC